MSNTTGSITGTSWRWLMVALGGKLICAGGGGFLTFLCDQRGTAQVLGDQGLERYGFSFDFEEKVTKAMIQ